jgi:hypothetical protein
MTLYGSAILLSLMSCIVPLAFLAILHRAARGK